MTEEIEFRETAPRDLVITNSSIEYGNIEAWINIIESYQANHPEHEVVILYEGDPINNMTSLYKLEDNPNLHGFQMLVRSSDTEFKDIPKLYRFLVEGASANFQRYIKKEMYKTLNLF